MVFGAFFVKDNFRLLQPPHLKDFFELFFYQLKI